MIYVECSADRTLIRSRTNISRNDIICAGGKGEVCNRLEERSDCIGLVDEDPKSGQPKYLKEMQLEKDLSTYGIKRKYDSEKKNYLVILCPTLEEWILYAVKEENIEIENYNLPNNPKDLRYAISFNPKKFENLLSDLKNSKRIKILKEVIER